MMELEQSGGLILGVSMCQEKDVTIPTSKVGMVIINCYFDWSATQYRVSLERRKI